MSNRGGKRPGAGRPKGSKNKMTIAKEAIAEVLDAPDPMQLAGAIHQRGHRLLMELERIALDPTQPVAARIVAARTALPFMLDKKVSSEGGELRGEALIERLNQGREMARQAHLEIAAERQARSENVALLGGPREVSVAAVED